MASSVTEKAFEKVEWTVQLMENVLVLESVWTKVCPMAYSLVLGLGLWKVSEMETLRAVCLVMSKGLSMGSGLVSLKVESMVRMMEIVWVLESVWTKVAPMACLSVFD